MQSNSKSNDKSHKTQTPHQRDMIHVADGTESGNSSVALSCKTEANETTSSGIFFECP